MSDSLNPADISPGSNLALSLGNTRATGGTNVAGQDNQVRSNTARSSGLVYFEVTNSVHGGGSSGNMGFGLASASHSIATPNYLGLDTTSVGYFPAPASSGYFFNNVMTASSASALAGTSYGVAVNFTTLLMWVADIATGLWNVGMAGTQNPATGQGGFSLASLGGAPWFICLDIEQTADSYTLNAGTAPYVGTPPTGFGPWFTQFVDDYVADMRPLKRKLNSAALPFQSVDFNLAPAQAIFGEGWRIQDVQSPHRRIERIGAIAARGDDGTQSPFNFFRNIGWATIQPLPPPHRFVERRGAIMPKEDGVEVRFINWRNFGWEIQPIQPDHPRPEKAAVSLIGEPGIEFPFIPPSVFLPMGFEIQPFQPDHPRLKHGAIACGDDGTQARFTNFFPAGWEIQPPVTRYDFSAQRYAAARGSSLFAIFSTWINAGWEIAPPFFRHPRPERSGAIARGDDGASAIFQAILPPPPSGYEAPFFYPRVPVQRRGAVIRDDAGFNIDATFRNFFGIGFENQAWQPFHVPRERAAALMIGENGTELPFTPTAIFPWGHEMPFLFPRKPFERAGAIVRDDLGLNIDAPFQRFFDLGFPIQPPQPPHPRPERAGSIARGDDGSEAPYVFVQPPFEQLVLAPPVYSRVRVERRAGIIPADPSDYKLFRFSPMGWEIAPPTLLRHDLPGRGAGLMPGGLDVPVRAPVVPWGHEAPYTALRIQKPLRGALIRGEDGIEGALSRLIAMGWEPSEPIRRKRRGWKGTEIFEQPVTSFPNFLKPTWVDESKIFQIKPHPRRGGALAIDNEMPQAFRFPFHAELDWFTPETFYRRRYTAAIVPWEGQWWMRRFVPVFYATSVITSYGAPTKITQAGGSSDVTAATGKTVIKGEPQGR